MSKAIDNKEYTVLYYPIGISKDEGMQNYASFVPDVDCCFGFGDTIEEVIENTKILAT